MSGLHAQRRATVAGCGAVAVDEILSLDRPIGPGKGRVISRATAHGGNIATALAAVSTLGGGTRWVGYLTASRDWANVRADLRSHSVDLDWATGTQSAPIRSTILVEPGGERFIAFDDATDVGAPAGLSTKVLAGVDSFLVDSYAAENGLELVQHARRAGIPVVADIERADTPVKVELMDIAGHLVIPWEFGREMTGEDSPEAAADKLWNSHREAVVITDGDRGAWYRTAEDSGHVPAFDVDAIDTSGCGDVFHGAYALRIGERASVANAVLHASAAAAICATAVGGRGHLPTEDDLEVLLAAR